MIRDLRMKLFEKLVILAVFSLGAVIWGDVNGLVGASVNNSAAYAAAKEVRAGAAVTFIELGSVRCIPCRMMQPVMQQVEQKYGGQVKVIFYDIWTPGGSPYAKKYGVKAIPTQVFLDRNGKEYFRHIGYFPFEELEQVLKKGGVR